MAPDREKWAIVNTVMKFQIIENEGNTMAWSYRKIARHRNLKKMLYGKLYATRRRGIPEMRWLDDVSMDMRKMGVNKWRDRARNREA